MDKVQLQKILTDYKKDDDLYEKITIIDKEKTNFSPEYYIELSHLTMFIYHMKYGIETVSKKGKIPKLFDKVSSYEDFNNKLEKYKEIEFHNEFLPDEKNMFDEICRLSADNILKKDPNWTRVYSSLIYKKDVENDGKLYVSIDNKDLYQFASLLLTKSLKAGIKDFEFKINNNQEVNRRDNIVIYYTKDNLKKYLSVIDKILTDNPNMQINDSHPLAFELRKGVTIAKDPAGTTHSFTSKLCDEIEKKKKSNCSNSEILEMLEEETNKCYKEMELEDGIYK